MQKEKEILDMPEVKFGSVTTRDLLADYTVLLNQYGADSVEAAQFMEVNSSDKEFVDLADTARWLKKALLAPVESLTVHAGKEKLDNGDPMGRERRKMKT